MSATPNILLTSEVTQVAPVYSAAVANGFTGTIQQWLASLTGPQGESAFDVAVANGFTGTLTQWLASLAGPQGQSAYQVAVTNGFTGTQAQWLASLVGAPGTTNYNALSNLPDLTLKANVTDLTALSTSTTTALAAKADATATTAALAAKADSAATTASLATKANTSSLGTAAALNVPASGDATLTQVVAGNDSRFVGTPHTSIANLYVFGDSISDPGNGRAISGSNTGFGNFPPGYVTDGIPYSVLLTQWLGVNAGNRYGAAGANAGGNNYAVSGATTQDSGQVGHNLIDQVAQWMTDYSSTAPAKSAALIFIGTNDTFLTSTQITSAIAELQTLINSLVAAGISKVIVPNLPIYAGNGNRTGTYNVAGATWNTQLATMLAATPNAVLFDWNAFAATVFASPAKFGFLNNSGNNTNNAINSYLPDKDTYMYFSQGLHPSGRYHKLVAQQILPLLASTYGESKQTDIAISTFGNQFAPTYPILQPPVIQTNAVVSGDPRLQMAAASLIQPQAVQRFFIDFENGIAGPPYSCAPYIVAPLITGTGNLAPFNTLAGANPGAFGQVRATTIASGDITGLYFPNAVFRPPATGILDFSYRFSANIAATDNCALTIGLFDSITGTTTNGVFLFISNNNGVVTGTLFSKNANVSTQVVFTSGFNAMVTDIFRTVRVVLDFTWTNAQVFVDGVLVAQGLVAPPASALLVPGFRNNKVGTTSLTSYFSVDMMNIVYFNNRP
jgi:hypothetical protein